ncbi:MAG TPA: UDP-2,3-diacylglucosamine diphosphatase LpxI [Candidatus Baltobacteraceae bacterium]|nr:UDP-2,3-diacylglucosamine diphosphatase LpxI [Candidatus Baltobacteraceae bacterium]
MPTIGILAGNGRLPFVAASEARAQGYRVVGIGLTGVTDPALAAEVDAVHWVKLGQLGAILDACRAEDVTDLVLLGKVEITNLFSNIRPDLLAAKVLFKARDLRGDTLLEAIVETLECEGLRVLETPRFLGPVLIQPGVLTRRAPSTQERKDIALGRDIGRQIAALRIGQTIVLKNGTVLAVESVEGTDAAIRRGGALGRGGVVVVKTGRSDQDLRFDLPTIGPGTLDALREAQATALAVDAGRTLLVDREAFLEGANALRLTVVAE